MEAGLIITVQATVAVRSSKVKEVHTDLLYRWVNILSDIAISSSCPVNQVRLALPLWRISVYIALSKSQSCMVLWPTTRLLKGRVLK